MRFKITNNPNYEIEERERQAYLRQQEEKRNEERRHLINKYLDDVQRILDNRNYKISYMCMHGIFREPTIKMVLGYSFYIYEKDSMLPIMNELSGIIHSKCPQWKVKGFHNGSKANDNHNGEYGIYITGDLSGL